MNHASISAILFLIMSPSAVILYADQPKHADNGPPVARGVAVSDAASAQRKEIYNLHLPLDGYLNGPVPEARGNAEPPAPPSACCKKGRHCPPGLARLAGLAELADKRRKRVVTPFRPDCH